MTSSPGVQGLAVQPDDHPFPDPGEQVGPGLVDQRDARLQQQLRPVVRVAPADARGRVHHRGDLAADQRVSADPVQVSVIDDGDIAGAEPLGQVLRPAVHPGWPRPPPAGHRAWLRCFMGSLRNCAIIAPSCQTSRAHGATSLIGRTRSVQLAAAARPRAGCAPVRYPVPAPLRGRPFRGRRGQQLPRVRPAKLGVLQAGQHPGQLGEPARVIEAGEAAAGDRAVVGLLDHQVGVGERGHLRQVRDDDHLREPGEPGQPAPDLHRGLAPHPGVHLVEHEGRDRVGAGEDHLDRQHDPGQLTARGALAERQHRGARVRGQPDLHLVRAVRAEVAGRGDRHGQPRVRHGEGRELGGDAGGEGFRRRPAQLGQLAGQLGDGRGELCLLVGEAGDPVVVALQLGEPAGGLFRPGEHRGQVGDGRGASGPAAWHQPAVGADEPGQLGAAFLHGREPGRVGVRPTARRRPAPRPRPRRGRRPRKAGPPARPAPGHGRPRPRAPAGPRPAG